MTEEKMKLAKKTFLERLEFVQAELRAIAQMLPEINGIQNNYGKDPSDVIITQLSDLTYFTFRLKLGHEPT